MAGVSLCVRVRACGCRWGLGTRSGVLLCLRTRTAGSRLEKALQEDVSELSPNDGQKLPKVHWQVGQRWFTNYLGCTGGRTRVVHELPGVHGEMGQKSWTFRVRLP